MKHISLLYFVKAKSCGYKSKLSLSYVYFNKHFHNPFPFLTFYSNDLMKNEFQKRSTKTRQRLYNNYSSSFLRIDERKVRGEKIKSVHQPPSEYSKYQGFPDIRPRNGNSTSRFPEFKNGTILSTHLRVSKC